MSDDFVPGQRIGDYEVLGVLGAGGMGKVYKVRNVISDRIEAMKVLLANLAVQKELADRFLREIKLLASLNHPNIAALNTALTLDNQLVMMMEYVDGVTLASRLQQGPIPPADAVNYSEQLLGALSYAHKLNVIHRDVKPANMMLTPKGVVKLMDFGIARPNNEAGMTVTGTTLGSLNYMSPEQVRGEPVDQRSDLYSMGVSLYEMVTGQLPFRGHSNYSVMSAHLEEAPQPPIIRAPGFAERTERNHSDGDGQGSEGSLPVRGSFSNALRSVVSGDRWRGNRESHPWDGASATRCPICFRASSGSGDCAARGRGSVAASASEQPAGRLHGARRSDRPGHSLRRGILHSPHHQDPCQPGRCDHAACHFRGCSSGHLSASARRGDGHGSSRGRNAGTCRACDANETRRSGRCKSSHGGRTEGASGSRAESRPAQGSGESNRSAPGSFRRDHARSRQSAARATSAGIWTARRYRPGRANDADQSFKSPISPASREC